MMPRLLALLVLLLASTSVTRAADSRPNIVWVVVEDQSRHYGCYGEPLVETPNIDRLAAEGVWFANAAVTAPVCSACRSALITGMYQTSIGAQHHRSGRGTVKIQLPEHVRLIPEYFREAGYYTCLGDDSSVRGDERRRGRLAKSDYNFEWDESAYDGSDWSRRKPGQPFFAQVQLAGGKFRPGARKSKQIPHVDAANVQLPPYYPNHPVVLEDWAAYLDTFSMMDVYVGELVERLKRDGVYDNTVIFFLTDHGVSHARGKQFCYDEGIMVPLIVRGPGIDSGVSRDDLVLQIDVAASSLQLAGIPVPQHLEGRPLFGPDRQPREFLVSARDRCDETYDRIRSVRTSRFKYIRNGYPQRSHLQPCVYKDEKDIYKAIREWEAAGKLTPLQQSLLCSPHRAPEELYDLQADRWELKNLADDPAYSTELLRLRGTLDHWIRETGDKGQQVEPLARYDSDMQVYLDTLRTRQPDRLKQLEANIRQMKDWWAAGK